MTAWLNDPGDRYVLDPSAPRCADWGAESSSGAVLVGPEGGLCRAEIEELEGLGCRAVSLGTRILRVETAAVSAAARLLL